MYTNAHTHAHTHTRAHTRAHTHTHLQQELLSRVPPNGPDGNSGKQQLGHLKDALARTNEDMGVLRNQLEQKDAALELMRRNYEAQVCVVSVLVDVCPTQMS